MKRKYNLGQQIKTDMKWLDKNGNELDGSQSNQSPKSISGSMSKNRTNMNEKCFQVLPFCTCRILPVTRLVFEKEQEI